jgi:hypothetical protein
MTMTTTLVGDGFSIDAPFVNCEYNVTNIILPLYSSFNKEAFPRKIKTHKCFCDFVGIIYDAFEQELDIELHTDKIPSYLLCDNKDVILGFSGGLDSAYQALELRRNGYNVHLFHVRGLNGYEGNKAYLASMSFADNLGFDFIEARFCRGKDFSMHWIENPIKNQLIQAIMLDIAIDRGYKYIAIGDDASMSFSRPDFILGTNTTDCREIQSCFEQSICNLLGDTISFLMIDREIGSKQKHKGERIASLIKANAIDHYYSCVGAGRFNEYNHRNSEEKYNIKLPKHNCGCFCAKCAMHNLLMHYMGIVEYPKVFIDACWDRLWKTKHGNIATLFSSDIPLEQRIKNLYHY